MLRKLTGVPTTGKAAIVEVTHLKPPSTHTVLKWIYAVNRVRQLEIEYIVVDGGSTDGTVREIENFANEMKLKSEVEQRRFSSAGSSGRTRPG